MDKNALFLVFAPAIAAVIVLNIWAYAKAKDILRRWAGKNGFEIEGNKYCLFKGPYFWSSSGAQIVFYVTVREQNGDRRSGWVRCGSWILGPLVEKIDVMWKELDE
jgi:hypothetical protein